MDEHPALAELLTLARRHVDPASLGRYVMSDPGTLGYIAALDAVLKRGSVAIEPSFDLTESIGPGVTWTHATDDEYRWFRVLVSAIRLYLGDRIYAPLNETLVMLLVDTRALGRELCEASTRLCRELPSALADPREGGFFMLGELLLLDPSPQTGSRISSLCASLLQIEAQCEGYYLPGEDWQENPWFVDSPELLWGWVSERTLHPEWIHLVQQHFPEDPPEAQALRQRLLADGARWATKRRRLS